MLFEIMKIFHHPIYDCVLYLIFLSNHLSPNATLGITEPTICHTLRITQESSTSLLDAMFLVLLGVCSLVLFFVLKQDHSKHCISTAQCSLDKNIHFLDMHAASPVTFLQVT